MYSVLTVQETQTVDVRPFDHSATMMADPGRYGFTADELTALTAEEMKIGMTKEFLQARAEMRLIKAKRKLAADSLAAVT